MCGNPGIGSHDRTGPRPGTPAGGGSVLVPQLEIPFRPAPARDLENRGDRRVTRGDDRVLAGGEVHEPEGAVRSGGEGVHDIARGIEKSDPGVLHDPSPLALTTPRSTAPPASSTSCRVSRDACTLTGRAAGRKAGALAARVYSPATRSVMT